MEGYKFRVCGNGGQHYYSIINDKYLTRFSVPLHPKPLARALLKRPKILIFDEAVSNLDQQTAEHFAQTINRLKGKVTMIFITHQVPKGLLVDEVVNMGQHAMHMSLVKE